MGKYKIAGKMRTHTNIDVHALAPVCLLAEKKKVVCLSSEKNCGHICTKRYLQYSMQ